MERDTFQKLMNRLHDFHEAEVGALQQEVAQLSAMLGTKAPEALSGIKEPEVSKGEEAVKAAIDIFLDPEGGDEAYVEVDKHSAASCRSASGTSMSTNIAHDLLPKLSEEVSGERTQWKLESPEAPPSSDLGNDVQPVYTSNAQDKGAPIDREITFDLLYTSQGDPNNRADGRYSTGRASGASNPRASASMTESFQSEDMWQPANSNQRKADVYNPKSLNRTLILLRKWDTHEEQNNTALLLARTTQSDLADFGMTKGSQALGVKRTPAEKLIAAPGANWRLLWDLSGAILIAYDTVAIPFTLAFQPRVSLFMKGMDWLTMFFWTADMVATFFVGYVEKGINVMHPGKIAKRYLSTWFLLDVLVISADWFNNVGAELGGDKGNLSDFGRLARSLRFIRVLRLLRLLKLRRMMAELQDHISSEYTYLLLSLIKMLIFIIFLNHCIACTWYLLGRVSAESGQANWIDANKMWSRSLGYKYTTSMHWTLTQFTPASMEVFPQNTGERTMSVIVLMFALVAFSSFVGSISTSMTQLRLMNADTTKQFWLLRRYIKQQNIPRNVGMRVLKYLEFVIERNQGKVQKQSIKILDFLSEQLQEELVYAEMRKEISTHAIFKYMLNISNISGMDMVVRRLCAAMARRNISTGENLFYPGDAGTNCYCFLSGRLVYTIDNVQLNPPVQELECISEASLFVTWRHMGRMRAEAETDLFVWEAARFVNICCQSVTSWTPLSAFAKFWLQNFLKLGNMTDVIRDEDFLSDIQVFAEQPLLDRQKNAFAVKKQMSGSILATKSGSHGSLIAGS